MQELKDNKPEVNGSAEQSPEPSQPSNAPFIPKMPLREVQATRDMLSRFREAIEQNEHWSGHDVQAVAMGLEMVKRMEGQYNVQVEEARKREKEKVVN